MTKYKKHGFATRSIRAGQKPDPATGAIMTPIYASSTFVQESPGVHKGYDYSRAGNPTRQAFEECLADLENGSMGFAFGSGMAASSTVLELLDSGSHVIAMDDMYGGTNRLFNRVRKRSAGLEFDFVDLSDPAKFKAAIKPNTKMVWVESPTNPLLKLVDLMAISSIARNHNILTVCDNTTASPYLQRPLDHGFDIVVHSVTKYLNGHSDMVGGAAIVGDNPGLADELKFLQMSVGGVVGPFDSFLALRGLKTLELRMERHCQNALSIAQYLEGHEKVRKVYYPGLASHPQFDLAKTQMKAGGGMVTMEIEGGLDQAKTFLEACEVFSLAESLGGVESLIEHPGIMTHASLSQEDREKLGIGDSLIRISVGIENIEDLIADLERGLSLI